MTVKAPPLTEAQFLRQVVELAEIRGWSWLHLRPGMTRDSWRTPISGPLGKGWPDLVLVRRGRIVFAELKSESGKLTPEQETVLEALANVCEYEGDQIRSTVEAYWWKPSNWPEIEQALK